MKAWLRNPVGVTVRLLWLGGVLRMELPAVMDAALERDLPRDARFVAAIHRAPLAAYFWA